LDHGDVTWDYPKGRVMGRRKEILKYIVLGRVGRIVGTSL